MQEFYENAVRGIGLGGKAVLYTNAVVLQRPYQPDEIIGFVCAQFFTTDGNSDVDLFPSGQHFDRVMYILTLGVKEEFRRIKLATRLLQWVFELATDNPDCGAVSHMGGDAGFEGLCASLVRARGSCWHRCICM